MAMPMRIVNVKHNIVKTFISRRLLYVADRRISVNKFSYKASSNPIDPVNEDGEDFFGIPENFKLQHARHGSSKTAQNSENTNPPHSVRQTVSEDISNAASELSPQDIMCSRNLTTTSSRQSRRERRTITQTAFGTTFGTISFDSAVVNTSNMTTEDLAHKARVILTKLSTENNNQTFSKEKLTKEQNHNFIDNKRKNQKASLKNSLETVIPVSDSHTAKSNYFDEVYFPEHSGQGHTGIPDQVAGQQISEPESSSVNYSELRDPQLLSSLSRKTFPAESNITKGTSNHCEGNQPSSEHSVNFLDEQYFGSHFSNNTKQSEQDNQHIIVDSLSGTCGDLDSLVKTEHQHKNHIKNHAMQENGMEFNEIDHQYFGDTFKNLHSNKDSNISTSVNSGKIFTSLPEIAREYINQNNLNLTEKDPVVANKTAEAKDVTKTKRRLNTVKPELNNNPDKSQLNMTNKETLSANVTGHFVDDRKELNETYKKQELKEDIPVITNEDFLKTRRKIKAPEQPKADKPETAYDVAMKIRHEIRQGNKFEDTSDNKDNFSDKTTNKEKHTVSGIKLDSKGFRLLDEQVFDLDKMTSADMVRMLKSRIIFDHEDFLAIDKPYGLPCISQSQDRLSVTALLPSLAAHLLDSYKASDLYLVQNLDRDVTGAIILAKNPEVAYFLQKLYKDSEMVTQRFWAITKGVPNPPAGVIDIPIGEAKVGNIYKMVLRPRFLKDEKLIGKTSKAPSERAITEYKVLSTHQQSALVECTLLTNVKHQIRLHLASGLSTPILGDHKYSNFSKLAPQKLHRDMLELLRIRQSKVRCLALHLHCRSIILKDYKGRTIFLTTNPPSHFKDNMHSLHLRRPK